MAIIGQPLTVPEPGWVRYNDTNANISYIGNWTYLTKYMEADIVNCYNEDLHYATALLSNKIKFNFTGTSLRIIGCRNSNRSQNMRISIDGIVYNYAAYSSLVFQALLYSKTGLANGEHYVTIWSADNNSSLLIEIDAIDIDANSILKPYNEVLTKLLLKDINSKCYGMI